jgi:hypothetical protein
MQYLIDIRPLMPTVLRGLSVPLAKQLYILGDACREASAWNIPFGKIADPSKIFVVYDMTVCTTNILKYSQM